MEMGIGGVGGRGWGPFYLGTISWQSYVQMKVVVGGDHSTWAHYAGPPTCLSDFVMGPPLPTPIYSLVFHWFSVATCNSQHVQTNCEEVFLMLFGLVLPSDDMD